MRNPLFIKCSLLALIGALLLIFLSMIKSTIDERTIFRAEAIQAIAAGSAGEQSMTGPVLRVPVIEEYDEELFEDNNNGTQLKRTIHRKTTHWMTIAPHQLNFDGNLNVQKRAYGLHETAVFELQGVLAGAFDIPAAPTLPDPHANARLTWGTPLLSLSIADARGLSGEPKIVIGDATLAARRGAPLGNGNTMRSGFHAPIDTLFTGRAATVPFRIDLHLIGTSSFNFVPVGETTTAELRGNWPHPSFGGSFLPRSHEVSKDGFTARWNTTALATNAGESQESARSSGFQVRLIEPVDIYRQATRAVKYGILFIVLSFSAFFLFEHLRSLPIHPIQYLLVGLAQAVFFLLLTSLSEHIAFSLAYLVSAGASIVLIGIYLANVLHGWQRGISFSVALAILYAALFGILRSEENALLLGSLLIFIALASIMLGTRRIDWYHLGRRESRQPATVMPPVKPSAPIQAQ